jgi:hypothetical protein
MKKLTPIPFALVLTCALYSCCTPTATNTWKPLDLSDPKITERIEAKKDKPDTELLSKITLPPKATKRQVRDYISAVLLATKHQFQYNMSSDPQVAMLIDVGHENIDELVLAVRGSDYGLRYLAAAIKALATNEDKERLISALYDRPELVEVIMAKGWTHDAEGILIKKLHENMGYLPSEWIAAVASLQNPSTYDDLASYFADGQNRRLTYKYISKLPGIDLTTAAPIAWEKSKGSKYELAEMTEAALSVGYMPALDFVFETLDNNNNMQPYQYSGRALIFQFTSVQGTNEDLKKWYAENRINLRFDTGMKKFIVNNKQP